jgi:putative transposase
MKFAFMQMHAHQFSIERMSTMLHVSRNGYYKFLRSAPSKRTEENKSLLGKIKRIHAESRETYGSPRVHAALKLEGESCSKKRVARIMKKAGIQAKMKKRFKVTTKVNPKAQAAPNVLNRNFTAMRPNERWVADITYIATAEGWLYVAVVLDLYSRRIVGMSMNERMTTGLVRAALEQALTHRKPSPGLVHHSDKGCQYTSHEFQQLLKTHQITVSMSGTGNCYDNAAMESFFHTLKTEHVYFEHYQTREQAKRSIFEYVEVFYNRQRLHSTLGYATPNEFEAKGRCPLNPGIFKDMMVLNHALISH